MHCPIETCGNEKCERDLTDVEGYVNDRRRWQKTCPRCGHHTTAPFKKAKPTGVIAGPPIGTSWRMNGMTKGGAICE